jgi:hypothetical protein
MTAGFYKTVDPSPPAPPYPSTDRDYASDNYSNRSVVPIGIVSSGTTPATFSVTSVFSPLSGESFYEPFNSNNQYYERIWVVPSILNVTNPEINIPIEFKIWNAYGRTNVLTGISSITSPGLIVNITPPDGYLPLFMKTVSLSLTGNAAPYTQETILFYFTYGFGTLNFEATTSRLISQLPESPIKIGWEFLTEVSKSNNQTEQRVSRREFPRISYDYQIVLSKTADMRVLYEKLLSNLKSLQSVPLWDDFQQITSDALISTSTINFINTDFKVLPNQTLFIYNTATRTGEIVIVNIVVSGSSITIKNPLQATYPASTTYIYYTATGIPQSSPSLEYYPINASVVSLSGVDQESKDLSNTTAVPTYDSMPILYMQNVYSGDTSTETFEINQEVIDFNQKQTRYTFWEYPEIQESIEFSSVNSSYRFWKQFFYTVKGGGKKFLMSTWRYDLELYEIPPLNSGSIKIKQSPRFTNWFNTSPNHVRLAIMNAETGTTTFIARKVLTAVNDVAGYTVLTLDANLPNTVNGVNISRISFLQITKSSDNISVTHYSGGRFSINFDVTRINQ